MILINLSKEIEWIVLMQCLALHDSFYPDNNIDCKSDHSFYKVNI